MTHKFSPTPDSAQTAGLTDTVACTAYSTDTVARTASSAGTVTRTMDSAGIIEHRADLAGSAGTAAPTAGTSGSVRSAYGVKSRLGKWRSERRPLIKSLLYIFLDSADDNERETASNSWSESPGTRVFGVDLQRHLRDTGREVPIVLISCINVLENHGIVTGIYRQCGIQSNIRRLRWEFDNGLEPNLLERGILCDIHCVASLLKQYFRQLPNPLFTYELYEELMRAYGHENSAGADYASVADNNNPSRHNISRKTARRICALQMVVRRLPAAHFRTAICLMNHLSRISKYKNVTDMTASNLAIVWAPNLIRSPLQSGSTAQDDTHLLLDLDAHKSLCTFLIAHAASIFGAFNPIEPSSSATNDRIDHLADCSPSSSVSCAATSSTTEKTPPIRWRNRGGDALREFGRSLRKNILQPLRRATRSRYARRTAGASRDETMPIVLLNATSPPTILTARNSAQFGFGERSRDPDGIRGRDLGRPRDRLNLSSQNRGPKHSSVSPSLMRRPLPLPAPLSDSQRAADRDTTRRMNNNEVACHMTHVRLEKIRRRDSQHANKLAPANTLSQRSSLILASTIGRTDNEQLNAGTNELVGVKTETRESVIIGSGYPSRTETMQPHESENVENRKMKNGGNHHKNTPISMRKYHCQLTDSNTGTGTSDTLNGWTPNGVTARSELSDKLKDKRIKMSSIELSSSESLPLDVSRYDNVAPHDRAVVVTLRTQSHGARTTRRVRPISTPLGSADVPPVPAPTLRTSPTEIGLDETTKFANTSQETFQKLQYSPFTPQEVHIKNCSNSNRQMKYLYYF